VSNVIERIEAKLIKDGACFVFTGAKQSRGYGSIGINGKKTALVHRVIYEHYIGPIPDGLTIDHLCRNRLCCNPEHLEAVSNKTNILRGEGPTAKNRRKTHCKRGHLLAGDNLVKRALMVGKRDCRECRNLLRRVSDRSARRSSAL
jgi:hypothetical protein